jgi:uncharacterized protein
MRSLIALLLFALPAAAAEPSLLTTAARAQVGVTTIYDPGYARLDFPGGDIAGDRGVCTDVIIRALRDGWGIDLQLAVNRDMQAAFGEYPSLWGLTTTDRSIDHRRVPNLQTLLTRIGASLPLTDEPTAFLPGDIITWMLPGNLPHIGIVSDQLSSDRSHPLIVHNIGAGALEGDILFDYQMTGHYRINVAASEQLGRLGR